MADRLVTIFFSLQKEIVLCQILKETMKIVYLKNDTIIKEKMISHTFTLDELQEAMNVVEVKKLTYGKIALQGNVNQERMLQMYNLAGVPRMKRYQYYNFSIFLSLHN